MSESPCKALDPRVRRTRQFLHDALGRLLETKDFEEISVQDITGEATLNRATFYDHYPDKGALLRCMVGERFNALLEARGVRFDGGCGSALSAIALGVCDYLAGLASSKCGRQRPLDPHLESAVISIVKDMLLEGLRKHGGAQTVESPEIVAGVISWAIYGGAKEWLEVPNRPPSEHAAKTIERLVKPILMSLGGGESADEAANAATLGSHA